MKKKLAIFVIFIACLLGIAYFFIPLKNQTKILSPLGNFATKIIEKPLDKYTYAALKKRSYLGSPITIEEKQKDDPLFSTFTFSYLTDGKKVSGLMNIPKTSGTHHVIVMFRGYIDPEEYVPGMGTQHAGEVFAQNGFITLAPDFLGYGDSASPSAIVMEERFETYTTALNLLASIKNVNQAIKNINGNISIDPEKVGIWAHSNGGQIALSVLEISGQVYPTVLWAPVSKPFPYSILYYTDDIPDHGKALRKVVANFEKDYDSEKYSLTNYLDWIKAPLELHQGGSDEAVPKLWSDQLVEQLKNLDKDISYFTYPGEDHNFSKGDWNTIVLRNIAFFRNYLR